MDNMRPQKAVRIVAIAGRRLSGCQKAQATPINAVRRKSVENINDGKPGSNAMRDGTVAPKQKNPIQRSGHLPQVSNRGMSGLWVGACWALRVSLMEILFRPRSVVWLKAGGSCCIDEKSDDGTKKQHPWNDYRCRLTVGAVTSFEMTKGFGDRPNIRTCHLEFGSVSMLGYAEANHF